jgi:hypothetical protein
LGWSIFPCFDFLKKPFHIYIYICMYVYLIVETAIYFRIAYTKKHIFHGT